MLSLALPVVLAELGWMAMGVVDTIMVGRISAEAVGAVGVGRAAFMLVCVVGIGLLFGLDTLVSRDFGAGSLESCKRSLVHGVYIGVGAGVLLTALLLFGLPLLGSLGLDRSVEPYARAYLAAVSWSVLPLLLYTGFRRYLQAVNRARPVMFALISANAVNVACNWVLIFGKLGFPALGVAGAGWATVLSMAYLALFLFFTIRLVDRESPSVTVMRLDPARMRRLLALGLPAAGQMLVEVGVFALATALAGRLAPSDLAAHHIALTMASVTFMVPLGISSAAAVRVGQALGRGDPPGAARSGWLALLLGSGFMLLAAVAFLVFPGPLVLAFTDDPRAVAAGVSLLAVAALFQLFDGMQIVATGALRGTGNTRAPLLWNFVGHWVLGLPIGYWLCFVRGWGVRGLWIGWLVGLILVGLVLVLTWARTSRVFATDPTPG